MKPTPEIVTLPARFFAGLQARFITPCSPEANNMRVIPKLWSEFVPRLREVAMIEPEVTYGLCACPGSLGLEATHPHEAVYLAAVQVAKETPAPPGMVIWPAAGGVYAKFVHRGPVTGIGETMGFIYGEWLPAGPHDHGPGPDIERYDSRFDPAGEESVFEIFVPIRAKAGAGGPG